VEAADPDVTGDVFILLRFSGRLNTRTLPRDVVADLAAILLPDAELSDLDWAPARVPAELAAKPGDTAIRWRR